MFKLSRDGSKIFIYPFTNFALFKVGTTKRVPGTAPMWIADGVGAKAKATQCTRGGSAVRLNFRWIQYEYTLSRNSSGICSVSIRTTSPHACTQHV